MLILTRKVGQTIVIDGKIMVTIMETRGRQVRIAVNAPKDISVHREEIQKKVDSGLVHEKKNHVKYESTYNMTTEVLQ